MRLFFKTKFKGGGRKERKIAFLIFGKGYKIK